MKNTTPHRFPLRRHLAALATKAGKKCGLGALLTAAALWPTTAAAGELPRITSVRVEAVGPVDEAALTELLELKLGLQINKHQLREVITTLYAGEQLEWVRIETTPSAEGVDVLVRLSNRSTLSDIKVRTKSPVLRVKVHRWLRLKLGDPVTAAGIEVSR